MLVIQLPVRIRGYISGIKNLCVDTDIYLLSRCGMSGSIVIRNPNVFFFFLFIFCSIAPDFFVLFLSSGHARARALPPFYEVIRNYNFFRVVWIFLCVTD